MDTLNADRTHAGSGSSISATEPAPTGASSRKSSIAAAEAGVSRSATRMSAFEEANLADEIWGVEMTFTPRTARDAMPARCARRADVPATRNTRREMSSVMSILFLLRHSARHGKLSDCYAVRA